MLIEVIDVKTFGAAVKTHRKRLHITQLHLAAIANTGVRFISDLENGKHTVQLDKALEVAKVLGLKVVISSAQGNNK